MTYTEKVKKYTMNEDDNIIPVRSTSITFLIFKNLNLSSEAAPWRFYQTDSGYTWHSPMQGSSHED